jgi:hypothetical protein
VGFVDVRSDHCLFAGLLSDISLGRYLFWPKEILLGGKFYFGVGLDRRFGLDWRVGLDCLDGSTSEIESSEACCVVNVLCTLDFIMALGGEFSSAIGFDIFSHSDSDSSVTKFKMELLWTSMPSGGWLIYTEASRLMVLNFSSSYEFVLTAFGNCLYPLPSSVLI